MGIVCCEEEDLGEVTPCELEPDELALVTVADEPVAAEARQGWQACWQACHIRVDLMTADDTQDNGVKLASRMQYNM